MPIVPPAVLPWCVGPKSCAEQGRLSELTAIFIMAAPGCAAAHENISPTYCQSPINMGTPVGNEAGPPITDQDLTPAFLAQSLQPNIYAACIVVTVAATFTVALRLLCRRLAKACLWWGTYLLESRHAVGAKGPFYSRDLSCNSISCLESAMNADFEIE